MKKKYFFQMVIFMLLFNFQLSAQSNMIRGTVTDTDDGSPLIGVNVVVQGSTNGTITDFNGQYELMATAADRLVFTYVGYSDMTVNINGRNTVDVIMGEGLQLDEVVVTAMGISREKKALGYAVESIGADDIEKSGSSNFVNALQGRISGVNIQSGSGAPGSGIDIKIRGLNSLDPSRSNTPLFIIDGVQMSNSTDVLNLLPSSGPIDNNSSQQSSVSNRAIDINPDDIATINVLKGAAATALYGARASNGAVIITTKRGEAGAARISLNTSFGIENVGKTPSIQTAYRDGRRGAVRYTGSGKHWYFQSQGPKDYGGDKSVIRNMYDDFYQTGNSKSIGLNISGGTEKATYFFSANNFDQKGIIRSAEYNRKNVRFGGDLKVNDWLKFRSSLSYTNSGGNKIHEGQKSVLSSLSFMNNSLDLNDYKNDDGTEKNPFLKIIDQPNYLLDVSHNVDNVNRYIGDIGANFDLGHNLFLDYTLGIDYYSDERERFVPPGLDLSSQVNGFIYEQRINSKQVTSLINLNYSTQLTDQIGLNAIIGNEIFSQNKDILNVRGEDFTFGNFQHISNASQIITNNGISKQNTIGAFGQLEFDYNKYAYLTLTGRNDWSSTLPKDNRSYFYPSASLSLIVSDMFDMPSMISFLKVRGSYAVVGKDARPYNSGLYYSQAGNFPFGEVNGFGQNTTVPSINLKPEFTKSTEFGIDFNLFKNRVGFGASVYKDKSTDLLMNVPVSNTTGAARLYTNAGSIENNGIELLLNIKAIKTTDFFWETGFNWSKNKGKVLEINNELGFITLYDNPGRARGVESRFIEGGNIGDIYAYDFKRSPEGDLLIDKNGYTSIDKSEKVLVGNAVPDFITNWINTIGYKSLELNMLWEWKKGGDVFDMGRRNGIRNGLLASTERRYEYRVINGVQEEYDNEGNVTGYKTNTTPIEWEPEGIQRSSSRFNDAGSMLVEDASWIRMRTLGLSYSLPSSINEKLHVRGAKVSLIGTNLFLNTPFQGYDPETNYFGAGSNILGYTGLKTPGTKSYVMSLKFDF